MPAGVKHSCHRLPAPDSTPTPAMNNELILIPWSGNSLWPVIKIHPVCEPQAQDRLAPARAELICTLPPSPQPPEGELIWTEHQRPSPSWCLSSPPLHGQGQSIKYTGSSMAGAPVARPLEEGLDHRPVFQSCLHHFLQVPQLYQL